MNRISLFLIVSFVAVSVLFVGCKKENGTIEPEAKLHDEKIIVTEKKKAELSEFNMKLKFTKLNLSIIEPISFELQDE